MECGCCCSNDPKWVEVTEADALFRIDRYYLQDGDIEHYAMRMQNGHCIAFRGEAGVSCLCSIYSERPTICRTVQYDSEICRASRASRAINFNNISENDE